jgi:hypothetical protein
MGQLDPPILPPYLYRYRGLTDDTIEREISMIRDQVLWCSSYKKLNDPMEGFYNPTLRVQHLDAYARVAHELVDQKHMLGICCLTDTPDNELMWTHYAENYTGICVSYRPHRLLKGLPDHAHLVRVGYGIAPPEIGVADARNLNGAALKILSHKKFNWSYEREWRVLAHQGGLHISTDECIRDVLLGSRIAPHHKVRIENALGDLPVRILTMKIDKYEHKWIPVKTLKQRWPQLAAE